MDTIRSPAKIPATPESPAISAMPDSLTRNTLFPVFLKLDQFRLLIVGGGTVGHEKLSTVLNNAPQTAITLVAPYISRAVQTLAAAYPNVQLTERPYQLADLEQADLVISAVNDPKLSSRIATEARAAEKLINVADQPALCDFYLGAIMQKGALKIAISTNGKSPTVARRIKVLLAEALPDDIDELLENIHLYRSQLSGSLPEKIKKLNTLTQTLTHTESAIQNVGVQERTQSELGPPDMLSNGAWGFRPYKFDKVNKKLLKPLLFLGIAGALAVVLLVVGFEKWNG